MFTCWLKQCIYDTSFTDDADGKIVSEQTFRQLEGEVGDIMRIVAGLVPNAIAHMGPGFEQGEFIYLPFSTGPYYSPFFFLTHSVPDLHMLKVKSDINQQKFKIVKG